jgi:hypothetical protein
LLSTVHSMRTRKRMISNLDVSACWTCGDERQITNAVGFVRSQDEVRTTETSYDLTSESKWGMGNDVSETRCVAF